MKDKSSRFKLVGNNVEWPNSRQEELIGILQQYVPATKATVITLIGSDLIKKLSNEFKHTAYSIKRKTIGYGTSTYKNKVYCIVEDDLIQYIFKEV